MKTVLFVPGFQEDLTTRDYKSTLAAITNQGYKAKFVPIKWARTTITKWVEELDVEYAKYNPATTILAGFSYGSMTAFIAAVNRNPAELWLFSFSPYFADDLPKMKKSWLKNIGHRRADAFRQLDFNNLAKSIKCKTLIVVGEVESIKYPLVRARAEAAHKVIANNKFIISPMSDHDVTDKNYIATIESAI